MALHFVQKFGFVTIGELLKSLHDEFTIKKGTGKEYFKFESATAIEYNAGGTVVNRQNTQSLGNVNPFFQLPENISGGGYHEKMFIYSATKDIDPLADYVLPGSNLNSSWRIVFHQIDPDRLCVYLGTEIQFPTVGNIAFLNQRETPIPAGATVTGDAAIVPKMIEPPGALNETWSAYVSPPTATTSTFGKPDPSKLDQAWINRNVSPGAVQGVPTEIYQRAYPMSYMLSLSNRGMYLGVWEDSQEEIPQWKLYDPMTMDDDSLLLGYGRSPFRWFVVQRAVDRITGHVRGGAALRDDVDPDLELSRCPVFCVGGTTRPAQFYKFVVRELDIVSPSRKKFAVVDSEDSPAVLNPWPQNSISESGEFVVTFINNLSTPRFRYADELDMVGTVGAEVIGGGSVITVNVYNEKYPRKYTAGYATNKFGTGMRVMVLSEANEEDEDSHVFKEPETFSLTPSLAQNSANGSVITFTLNTTGVSNNKVLHYHINSVVGKISRKDFSDEKLAGTFTIQNNTALVSKTISSSPPSYGSTFAMVIRKLGNQVGNVIATSGNITIT
jgi:hypothetical protein